jgi:glycosyltransferase involved in cell wall biosynthesis
LKVLILAPNVDLVGGANVLIFKVARYLISKGDDVQVWSNLVDPCSRFQEKQFIIKNIGKGLTNNSDLKKLLGIISYPTLPSEMKNFDMIFCHNFPSYFSTLSLNFHGIPTVWQCNEPSVILYPLPSIISSTKSIYYSPVFAPIQFALRKVDLLAVNRITKITCLSKFVKDRVRLFYNRDSEIIRIGTDINRFNSSLDGSVIREQYGISDRPCILSVGNMDKRVDLVINAVAKVKKSIPDIVYMIVGPCSPETKVRLTILVRSLGLESNVIITGENLPQGSDLIPFYYAACDVFVFPQPYWSWSMVTVEAMATGKPVIVPNVSGISEIISDQVNGIKLPLQETELLSKTIVYLLQNEMVRQRMGELAREYVVKHLQESQFLAKTYDVLKKTCNRENIAD